MKVLVIFDLVPEETKKAVVEMTEEEYTYFSKGNGIIVNVDNDEEGIEVVLVISNALSENSDHIKYCETDTERKYFGKWKPQEVIQDISGVDRLITCGFYL